MGNVIVMTLFFGLLCPNVLSLSYWYSSSSFADINVQIYLGKRIEEC